MIDLRKESSCTSSPGLELAEILEKGEDKVEVIAYEHDIPESLAVSLGKKYGYRVEYLRKESFVLIRYMR